MTERGRSGTCAQHFHDGGPADIVYLQCSDVPMGGLVPGQVLDRLLVARGSAPFAVFAREALEAAPAVRITA